MAFLSDVYAEYTAKLGISRPLTRDERRRALYAHIAAMAAPPQELLETATSYACADVAREIAAFGRLAEDEAHESS